MFLSLVIILQLSSVNGFAATNILQANSQISKDEAGTIAIIFIANSIKSNTNLNWDRNTKIKKIVPLYDVNDSITAYCYELTKNGNDNGYVVVSTSDDTNVIQEFSDTAKPLYAINNSSNIKVYLLSALEYYIKDNNEIKDLSGKIVDSKKLKNGFKKDKKISEENASLRKVIKEKGNLKLNEWMLGYSGQVTGAGNYAGIYDSYAYVNDRYGSGWVSDYYNNSLESKITKHLLTETDYLYPNDNGNNCSLTALATIFEYHRYYGGCTNLPNSFTSIYQDIHTIAKNNGWWTSSGGTNPTYIDDIATQMFIKYNYTNGRGNNDYILDWNVARAEIDQGRPFCFNMANDYYANHTVVVYAYSAYKKTGYSDVCFLKVADGWTTDSRYIDWNQFVGFGSWTKVFPF